MQTYNPDNFSIECSTKQDYRLFYNTEINLRQALNYPPFCDIIVAEISLEDQEKLSKISEKIYSIFEKNIKEKNIQNIKIFKPAPAPIDKIKNRYRWRIIIKCNFDNNIIDTINKSLEECYKIKQKDLRILLDVNPTSMM